jgi:hypothetical protein
MTPGGPGIERIGQIAIPVADLERAVACDSEGNLLALMSEVRPPSR